MATEPNRRIPVLTEAIDRLEPVAEESPDRVESEAVSTSDLSDAERESLIAELQTQLAAGTFALTDEILRASFSEMEASIFERISSRLRSELPEMIDRLLRERLGDEPDY